MSKGGSRFAPLIYFLGWIFRVECWIFILLTWSVNK